MVNKRQAPRLCWRFLRSTHKCARSCDRQNSCSWTGLASQKILFANLNLQDSLDMLALTSRATGPASAKYATRDQRCMVSNMQHHLDICHVATLANRSMHVAILFLEGGGFFWRGPCCAWDPQRNLRDRHSHGVAWWKEFWSCYRVQSGLCLTSLAENPLKTRPIWGPFQC